MTSHKGGAIEIRTALKTCQRRIFTLNIFWRPFHGHKMYVARDKIRRKNSHVLRLTFEILYNLLPTSVERMVRFKIKNKKNQAETEIKI